MILLIVFLFSIVECLLIGELFILEKLNQTAFYKPILTTSIDPKHRRLIKKILSGDFKYLEYDFDLGWNIIPNGSYDNVRANSQGIRADKEYTYLPQKGITRLTAFGDSFTHCNDVKNNETWEEQLNSLDPRIETINFGVVSYGLDQSYLR